MKSVMMATCGEAEERRFEGRKECMVGVQAGHERSKMGDLI